jgi:hypothetical protein
LLDLGLTGDTVVVAPLKPRDGALVPAPALAGLMGAVTGVGVGGLQALVLARQRISGAAWWAAANPPAWAPAWLVSFYVLSSNVDEQFTNFGASGALLFALLTGLLLELLFRRGESQARTT